MGCRARGTAVPSPPGTQRDAETTTWASSLGTSRLTADRFQGLQGRDEGRGATGGSRGRRKRDLGGACCTQGVWLTWGGRPTPSPQRRGAQPGPPRPAHVHIVAPLSTSPRRLGHRGHSLLSKRRFTAFGQVDAADTPPSAGPPESCPPPPVHTLWGNPPSGPQAHQAQVSVPAGLRTETGSPGSQHSHVADGNSGRGSLRRPRPGHLLPNHPGTRQGLLSSCRQPRHQLSRPVSPGARGHSRGPCSALKPTLRPLASPRGQQPLADVRRGSSGSPQLLPEPSGHAPTSRGAGDGGGWAARTGAGPPTPRPWLRDKEGGSLPRMTSTPILHPALRSQTS